jgi:hypothetical protein
VLVIFSLYAQPYRGAAIVGGRVKLLRGATDIWNQGTTNLTIGIYNAGSSDLQLSGWVSGSYLDSPSTTSATTYKLQGRPDSTGNAGVLDCQANTNTSTITLLEIGA